ncbi:Dynamin-related protein 5A [Camellia lanceoleosa]|uniref:Dynamin-related protein 5A n=1 Tax=Camellia lanceoleosa TaxID=1840588 RepID=A0ACC0FR38_9ERIC|nr:Dynamin-related protein 5A [Camellia lanceoleosa]
MATLAKASGIRAVRVDRDLRVEAVGEGTKTSERFKKIPLQISETGWPSKGDEALLKKTKAAVSSKPIVMRVEYAHCPTGIFDIKWSPVGAIVGPLLAQANADGYLKLHHIECCSDGSTAGGNRVYK